MQQAQNGCRSGAGCALLPGRGGQWGLKFQFVASCSISRESPTRLVAAPYPFTMVCPWSLPALPCCLDRKAPEVSGLRGAAG